MKKQVIMLTVAFALTAGYVCAADMEAMDGMDTNQVMAPVEVSNAICPLTGRELNLNDPNDYTSLEVEGLVFNVCPKGKAEYEKDPALFAEKMNAAVAASKADMEEMMTDDMQEGDMPEMPTGEMK